MTLTSITNFSGRHIVKSSFVDFPSYFGFFFALSLFLFPHIVCPQSHDALFECNTTVTITPTKLKPGSYSVNSVEKCRLNYLSERSKNEMSHSFYSSFTHRLYQVKFSFDNKDYDLDKAKKYALQAEDVLINDDVYYKFELPRVPEIGDLVEYECSYRCFAYSFLENYSIPDIDSIANYTIVINHPPELHPEFHIVASQDPIGYTVDNSDKEQSVLNIHGIVPPKKIPFFNANKTAGHIVISIKKDGEETLPVNTKGLFAWYDSLAPVHPRLDEADRSILSDTLNKQTSALDKIKTIYDFVRNNFRYVAQNTALSGIVPRKPSAILASKYADCKERASLICAIAAEYNLPVHSALYPKRAAPESDFVYPEKFSHVINAYTGKDDTVFFDATSQYAPFGVLPEREIDEKVFVLDNNNPHWSILSDTNNRPGMRIEISGHIDSLNKAVAKIIFSKQSFILYTQFKKDLTAAKLENALSSYISMDINKIRIENFTETTCWNDSVQLQATVDLSSFIIKTAKKIYAPKIAYSLWGGDLESRAADTLALYFEKRLNISLAIRLSCPELHTQRQEMSIGDENTCYFRASAESEKEGVIKLDYVLKQNHRIIRNKVKPAFFDALAHYKKAKTDLFVLGENNVKKDNPR
jgi:hypothetical protein